MPRTTPATPTPLTPAPLTLPLTHAPSPGVQQQQQHLAACERGHKATETTEPVSIREDERLGLSAISAGFNAVGSSVLMQEPRDNGERVVREAPEAPAPEQVSMREPQNTRAERISEAAPERASGAAQKLNLAEDQLIHFEAPEQVSSESPEQVSLREPQTTRAERVSEAAQELDLAEEQLINFADTGAALGVFLCGFF